MLFRRVRSVLAAAVAIGGLLLALPQRAGASAPASPALLLVGQSPTVTPAAIGEPAPFSITVKVVGSPPVGGELGLTVYGKFTTRSAFDQSLGSPPTGTPMHVVAPQPLAGLKSANGGVQITTTVVPGATPAGTATIGLSRCVAGNGSCSGVYPVEVQLFGADGGVVAHLTTYLTYAEEKSANSLVFSWVVPIGGPIDIRPAGPLPRAIAPLSPTRVAHLAYLTDTLADTLGVQVSVAPSPATVQRLELTGSRNARAVLSDLKAIASAGAGRLVAQPYVPINLSAVSQAGIDEEIKGQIQGAEGIMTEALAGVAPSDQPSYGTWLEDGPVNPAVAKGLADVGAKGIVVPDTDLAPATEQSDVTWSQPFFLTLGRASVPAAVSDSELSAHFTAPGHDPVLAANQLLAELAFIHFELPNPREVRGVIAMPPSDWDPDPQFVSALVSGLDNNPVVATATLTSFFSTVPMGGNGAPSTRHLAAIGSGQQISSSEAAAIVTARKQINGFTAAVGTSAVANQLEELLLSSESSQLSTEAQRAGIATFEHHLNAELSDIKVVPSTVTLTARTASIPITILSSADFPLKATLFLSSAKLQFPGGASRTVDIDHPTNSTQIEVRARTTGDLPLDYKLLSPGGGLVITQGRLTVRSTATSIVGIVLTLVAASVLLGWWARTWQRGRRQRRARPARGGPA